MAAQKNSSGIITLTSDWGEKDYYAGAVKGSIFSLMREATIVDITHTIKPFDITEAAYILKNAFGTFPPGTVHVIGVDSEDFAVNDNIQSHLAISYSGHYFIGADNGIFSLLMDKEKVESIVELTIPFDAINDKLRFTFSCRDRFIKAAVHLAKGGDMLEIGKLTEEFKEVMPFSPSYGQDYIKGVVVHVDHFENAITNITEELFDNLAGGRQFKISFKRNNKISQINKLYSDSKEVQPLAIFNGAGVLEIAINRSNASGLLGLRKNDSVMIEFVE